MTIVFKLFVHSPQAENCANFLCSFTLTHRVLYSPRSTRRLIPFLRPWPEKNSPSLACPGLSWNASSHNVLFFYKSIIETGICFILF